MTRESLRGMLLRMSPDELVKLVEGLDVDTLPADVREALTPAEWTTLLESAGDAWRRERARKLGLDANGEPLT